MRKAALIALSSVAAAFSLTIAVAADDVNDANVTRPDNSNAAGAAPSSSEPRASSRPNSAAPATDVNDANVENRDDSNVSGSGAPGRPDDPQGAAASGDTVNDANVDSRTNSDPDTKR